MRCHATKKGFRCHDWQVEWEAVGLSVGVAWVSWVCLWSLNDSAGTERRYQPWEYKHLISWLARQSHFAHVQNNNLLSLPSTRTCVKLSNMTALMTTSLPQVVTMGTTNSLQGTPAVHTITAGGLNLILVPTTMVPENTAIAVSTTTAASMPDLTVESSASSTPATESTTLTLKPFGVQVLSSSEQTPTRTPPLKPPKKFRAEQEEQTRCKRRLDFASLGLHSLQRPSGARGNRRFVWGTFLSLSFVFFQCAGSFFFCNLLILLLTKEGSSTGRKLWETPEVAHWLSHVFCNSDSSQSFSFLTEMSGKETESSCSTTHSVGCSNIFRNLMGTRRKGQNARWARFACLFLQQALRISKWNFLLWV